VSPHSRARTTLKVMSRAIARRGNVAAYLTRCGWDVDRAATASLVAFARSSSTVKPGTEFKVPPPPVTSGAIGTGGRSSFRCVAHDGTMAIDGARDGGARARGGRRLRGHGDRVGNARGTDGRGLECERSNDDIERGLTDCVALRRVDVSIAQRYHVYGVRGDRIFGEIRDASRGEERFAHDSPDSMRRK
jgi:hypothetical protein